MRFPDLFGGATLLSGGSLGVAAGVAFMSALTVGPGRAAGNPAVLGIVLVVGGLLAIGAGGYGFFRGLQARRTYLELTDREFIWHRGNRTLRVAWDSIADVADLGPTMTIRTPQGTLQVPNEYVDFPLLVETVKRRGR